MTWTQEHMERIARLPRKRINKKVNWLVNEYHIAEVSDISIWTVKNDIKRGKLDMSDLISISSYITAKHRLQ